ncbi:MAG: YbhB/YbcL family Raf kinase inhibitor-like protein [Dissulfuribacterales bacterium]
MKLFSPAFENEKGIPKRYTADGQDISPPLFWEGVPSKAKSLVLIVDDPDAPDPKAPRMVWVHWVLYNIPPNVQGLSEGIKPQDLPSGTLEGLNDWKRTGYGGPAPPIGRHRYFFKLYALDTVLSNMKAPTKSTLLEAMNGHVIAEAVLIGTYSR